LDCPYEVRNRCFCSTFATRSPCRSICRFSLFEASDKCHVESECLSYRQHIQVVNNHWKKYWNTSEDQSALRTPHVIFTTESKAIFEEHRNFTSSEVTSKSFPYTFVTNKHDILPDSGRMTRLDEKISADDAILSAISTLQLQLTPRISILHCCSGYHRMISAFLMEGLGAASQSTAHCLQEEDDPNLRVCCHHAAKDDSCWKSKARGYVTINVTK